MRPCGGLTARSRNNPEPFVSICLVRKLDLAGLSRYKSLFEMKDFVFARKPWVLPAAAAITAVLALAVWLSRGTDKPLARRVPGTDNAPGSGGTNAGNPVLLGKVSFGEGQPAASLQGEWPQFRGPNLDGISPENTPLARSWGPGEPKEMWAVALGEGYAGPAVSKGRVYLMDYDQEKRQDALRCLSLEDGREIWRFAYPIRVKRNHGMSRTVPVVAGNLVAAMGPKCHVVCLDSGTGQLRWGIDLVQEYGATIPQWYAGQCPIIENGNLLLAPGGPQALVLCVEAHSGKPVWKTPNPREWNMTHASLTPMVAGGERMYIYCADKGVVGVSASDGELLWETTEWKISIATVASPVVAGDGLIFFSGGYNAGSLMMRVAKENGAFTATPVFRLPPEVFGATQQTPILYQGHIYGVRPDGKFVCLDLEGKVAWVGENSDQYGLGACTMGDGLVFAVNDTGLLRLIEASPARYNVLSKAQVLNGREAWGPIALAGGRLLARDLTRMVCLKVSK